MTNIVAPLEHLSIFLHMSFIQYEPHTIKDIIEVYYVPSKLGISNLLTSYHLFPVQISINLNNRLRYLFVYFACDGYGKER